MREMGNKGRQRGGAHPLHRSGYASSETQRKCGSIMQKKRKHKEHQDAHLAQSNIPLTGKKDLPQRPKPTAV